MIERFQLLRNVGQFDSVSPRPQLALGPLGLIYGENGRGKTTLAAILRSLATGDSNLISERKRLGAVHDPHVVIEVNGQAHIFQNGAWSATIPDISIFDDEFVALNVCSGIEIGASHRQNLHELVLGAQGVALNATLQGHVSDIEQHNRELRAKSEAIPASVRGVLSVDDFCSLPPNPEIDVLIENAEQRLAAAQAADQVAKHAEFIPLSMPSFDVPGINELLQRDLPNLQQETANRVQAHLAKIGPGSAAWVSQGMQKIPAASEGLGKEACPFCMQDLQGSPIIRHYEAYFSSSYATLRDAITDAINALLLAHGGDVTTAFERSVRVVVQTQEFWGRFIRVVPIDLDTAAIYRVWDTARDAVMTALKRKESAPLERMSLTDEALAAIQSYNEVRTSVSSLSESLLSHNQQIALVKEQAAAADVTALNRDVARLRATKARHTEPLASRQLRRTPHGAD